MDKVTITHTQSVFVNILRGFRVGIFSISYSKCNCVLVDCQLLNKSYTITIEVAHKPYQSLHGDGSGPMAGVHFNHWRSFILSNQISNLTGVSASNNFPLLLDSVQRAKHIK